MLRRSTLAAATALLMAAAAFAQSDQAPSDRAARSPRPTFRLSEFRAADLPLITLMTLQAPGSGPSAETRPRPIVPSPDLEVFHTTVLRLIGPPDTRSAWLARILLDFRPASLDTALCRSPGMFPSGFDPGQPAGPLIAAR